MNHSRLVVKAIPLPASGSFPSGKRSGKWGQPAATVCFNRGHTVTSHKPKGFWTLPSGSVTWWQSRCPCWVPAESKNLGVALIWVQIPSPLLRVPVGHLPLYSGWLGYIIGLWGALNKTVHIKCLPRSRWMVQIGSCHWCYLSGQ